MATMNDEERARALSQIPLDNYQAPRSNSFGDAAAAMASPSVTQVGAPLKASGPLARAAGTQALSTLPISGSPPASPAAGLAAPTSGTTAPPAASGAQPAANGSTAAQALASSPSSNKVSFDPATNAYSGGNVGGNISINDQAPSGGFLGAGQMAAVAPRPASAADALISRALGAQSSAVPQFNTPQVAHSGNDWEARNNLRNAAVSASSITNSRQWGGVGAGFGADARAYRAALANDSALQQAQPGLENATMQANAALLREGMQQGGQQQSSLIQAAMGQQRNETDLNRTAMSEAGSNQRALLQTLGGIQEAQLRANAAKTPPAGYRSLANGNLQAIPGGPADPAASKEGLQQTKDTQDVFSILDQARPLMDTATGSYAGAAADKLARVAGISTEGGQAAAQLKALQGALVSKMPKMSGPQSDKDVLLYREMAGQIGDPTIPIDQRKAAMKTVEDLNMKYLPVANDAAAYQAIPSGSYFKTADGSVRRKQ